MTVAIHARNLRRRRGPVASSTAVLWPRMPFTDSAGSHVFLPQLRPCTSAPLFSRPSVPSDSFLLLFLLVAVDAHLHRVVRPSPRFSSSVDDLFLPARPFDSFPPSMNRVRPGFNRGSIRVRLGLEREEGPMEGHSQPRTRPTKDRRFARGAQDVRGDGRRKATRSDLHERRDRTQDSQVRDRSDGASTRRRETEGSVH